MVVTAGSTPQWADKAKQDADVIYSGAKTHDERLCQTLPGSFEMGEVQLFYLRPVAIWYVWETRSKSGAFPVGVAR